MEKSQAKLCSANALQLSFVPVTAGAGAGARPLNRAAQSVVRGSTIVGGGAGAGSSPSMPNNLPSQHTSYTPRAPFTKTVGFSVVVIWPDQPYTGHFNPSKPGIAFWSATHWRHLR